MKSRDRKKSSYQSLRERLKDRKGTTMVEMVVSFLLLAIFLTTVTMVISNALMSYYTQKDLMSKFSVADTVLSELRKEIRTMQSSELGGFLKIRNGGASATADEGTYTGDGIEFLRSNDKDGRILVQMDAAGCGSDTYMIDKEKILKSASVIAAEIPADQLTCRYYLQTSETEDKYDGLFMDFMAEDTDLSKDTAFADAVGHPVVWDVENRLPATLYQGLPIRLLFSVKPYEDNGEQVVGAVDVTVQVLKEPVSDEVPDPEVVYSKAGTIPLQNRVVYQSAKTVYSES